MQMELYSERDLEQLLSRAHPLQDELSLRIAHNELTYTIESLLHSLFAIKDDFYGNHHDFHDVFYSLAALASFQIRSHQANNEELKKLAFFAKGIILLERYIQNIKNGQIEPARNLMAQLQNDVATPLGPTPYPEFLEEIQYVYTIKKIVSVVLALLLTLLLITVFSITPYLAIGVGLVCAGALLLICDNQQTEEERWASQNPFAIAVEKSNAYFANNPNLLFNTRPSHADEQTNINQANTQNQDNNLAI